MVSMNKRRPLKAIAGTECEGGIWMIPIPGKKYTARLYEDGIIMDDNLARHGKYQVRRASIEEAIAISVILRLQAASQAAV